MNNMKRMRGRQNRPGGNGGGGGGGGGPAPIRHQGGNIPLNRNHSFDSSGPDVRVRGTAQQLFEKYLQLGRDATSGGDRVMAESYFQHAEHYFRILNAMNQAVQGGQNNQGQRRYGDNEAGEGDEQSQDETAEAPQQQSRPDNRPDSRPDSRSDNRNENRPYENRNRGNDGNQRYEPREPRVEPQRERLPGTGDQPDARDIPIAAAPPES